MNATNKTQNTNRVNWQQVGLFLFMTFALSWGLDLLLELTSGYGSNPQSLLLLQLQMLLPAFSAILLSAFFFKDSPIYYRNFKERPRWFFYFYLLFTMAYIALAILAVIMPAQGAIFSAIGSSLSILALLVLLGLRGFSNREAFARAGLVGGKARDWVLYGLAFVGFYTLSTGLNALFKLGQPVDISAIAAQSGMSAVSTGTFILLSAVQTVLVAPLLSVPIAFGEEYGWRSFLQGQLTRLGKKRGVLLVGLIWSVWHYPVILMGHNYPGQPVLGVLMMTAYTTALAFILGYAMLKTGSIWLVAYLHALNNQTYSYLSALIYKPDNAVLAFGGGLFGVLLLIPIVLLLLRDPVWRDRPSSEQALHQPASLQNAS
jgi:uncharacterized protein